MRLLLLFLAASAMAAEVPSASVAASADPAQAVVGEGRFRYRARDVDALVLVAKRHAKGRLQGADEEAVRQAIAAALLAREPLLEALDGLPLERAAREALVLDLLDFQGEPLAAAGVAAAPAASATGPAIVPLPPLPVNRTIGGAKRGLIIGLALLFPDAASAKRFEAQAPLIQDAILGASEALDDALIAVPTQAAIRSAFLAALRAKLPGFPAEGLLITRLETQPPP